MYKFFKFICTLIVFIILTGCNDYGEKRIVKFITVDKNNIALYYYDYRSQTPDYCSEIKENKGIENTLTELLSTADYDLKLCKYAVCDRDIIENNITELFYGLTNSKFSPDIIITVTDKIEDYNKYTNINLDNYPLYNCYIDDMGINTIVEDFQKNKMVILNGKFYKKLCNEESFAFDVINNKINKGIYTFDYYGKTISVQLENIRKQYSVQDNVLRLKIQAALKNYKGIPSGKEDKKDLVEIVENSLCYNIENTLNDNLMSEKLKLIWYINICEFDNINISVDIK